jgi:hypothetical protein
MRRTLAPVIGDLIEEYREVVRPSRGRLNAAVWFVTQIASLLQPWMWGLILGVTLGGLNLVSAAVAPLAEDTPATVLFFGASILASWVFAGFAADRRSRRFKNAIFAGAVVATLAMGIFSAANFARKMVFLDTLQHRSDWQGLLGRFQTSGERDLRTFVIREHVEGLPAGILFSLAIGALCGGLGGAYSI